MVDIREGERLPLEIPASNAGNEMNNNDLIRREDAEGGSIMIKHFCDHCGEVIHGPVYRMFTDDCFYEYSDDKASGRFVGLDCTLCEDCHRLREESHLMYDKWFFGEDKDAIDNLSDGYHTFKSLYWQRLVLFSVIVETFGGWKSFNHEDGQPCFGGGWFIVGVDTPEGSYTYHFQEEHWEIFNCEILPNAKHWDGHTDEDVNRLRSLLKRAGRAAAAGDTSIQRRKG